MLHIFDGGFLAHHSDAVAQLNAQIGGGKQSHTATVDACHIHAIVVAESERAQSLAVDIGLSDHNAARYELAVDSVPVHRVFVEVGFFLFAKEQRHCRAGGFVGDYKYAVVFVEHRFARRDNHFAIVPQARNDEFLVGDFCQFADALAKHAGIIHMVCSHESAIFGGVGGNIHAAIMTKHLLHHQQCQNHTHHAQRISDSSSQSGTAGGLMKLGKGLLSSTEGWSVGGGTTHHTHRIGQ